MSFLTSRTLKYLLALKTIFFLGLVKRGTIEDIGDSLGDALGINNKGILEEIEDIDVNPNLKQNNQTKPCSISENQVLHPGQWVF